MEFTVQRIKVENRDADNLCKGCMFTDFGNQSYDCSLAYSNTPFKCVERSDENMIAIEIHYIWKVGGGELREAVEDWIADASQKDHGKVFAKDTDENEMAQVTYGELRKLMDIIDELGGKSK